MAYMDEQAEARARARQQMLGGQRPQAIGQEDPEAPQAQGVQLPTNLNDMLMAVQQFLAQSAVPKGVKVDPVKELQVPETIPMRGPSPEPTTWRGDDIDLGGALTNMFKNATNEALQNMQRSGQRGADPRARSTTGATERAQRLRDTTPGPYAKGEAATQYVQDKIPGLKPAIDTSVPKADETPRTMAYPGEPAARAYLQQQRTDIPPIVMTDKANLPAGYEEDLKFLQDRGGHHSKLVDGKIVDAPLTEKGGYKDLDPEMAARLRKAGEDYEATTGKKAVFGEFSRGEDVQKIYRDRYESGSGGIAAKPGQSRHQHGGAGDIPPGDFLDWTTKNGGKYGVHFPVKGDAVHVQMDPAYKGESFVKPATPSATANLPPWDKGLPVVDPKTNWPDPSQTTPAAAITAKPVDTTTGAPAGGEQTLAAQRADYKAQADANPSLRETMGAIMISESSTPEGQQGTAEAMMNRVKANNRPFTDAMDPNYHADYMVRNRSKFDAAVAKIRNNPELKKQVYDLQDKAFNGSNVSKLATDYAGPGRAERSAKTSTETYASPDGQRFFRKDLDPVEDGPGQVAANKKWHKETTEAMAKPAGAPAGPDAGTVAVATPGEVTKPDATASAPSAPSASGAADVFEKGAEAVPVPGVGGMQEDVDYAGLQPTTTTTQDSAAAALNAIQKPEPTPEEVFAGDVPIPTEGQPTAAAVPESPPAVTPPAASTPSPPPAAAKPVVTAPPPPPPPRAAPPPPPAQAAPVTPPVKQQTGLDRAHGLLDMPAGEFVKKYAPEHLGKVKSFGVENTPMRDLVQKPFVGSQIVEGLRPAMESKFGFTMNDFQKAMTQPSPNLGKRSENLGTSGATDMSARARTPLAPPGLDGKPQERIDPAAPPTQAEREYMELADRIEFNQNARKEGKPELPLDGPAPGRPDLPPKAERAPVTIDETGGLPDLPSRPPEQTPQTPQVTPSIADALVESVKDQGAPPIDMKPSPEALPVLPATAVAPPQPGAPGGLSLAPGGLDLAAPGAGPFQTAMGAPGSQGAAISMLGMLPQIQNSTFSTPLLDQQATMQPSVGQGSLSPIPWDVVGGWGWGGGPSSGIGDFGGGGGFGGFGGGFGDGGGGMFGGGGGMFPMPMTWGG